MTFKENLLEDLHAERVRLAGDRRRRRVAARTAAVTGTAAALAVAGSIATTMIGTSGDAAYAITQTSDTVTVHISELRDPDKLEADLLKRGIRADITYLPDGKQCQRDRNTRPNPVDFGDLVSANGFKLYPRRIPKGDTIVLDVSEGTPLNANALIIGMASGQNVHACVLEPHE